MEPLGMPANLRNQLLELRMKSPRQFVSSLVPVIRENAPQISLEKPMENKAHRYGVSDRLSSSIVIPLSGS